MQVKSIKITKDATLQMTWEQPGANGDKALWSCKNALPVSVALADAFRAVVPHAANAVKVAQRQQELCTFVSMTIKPDKKDDKNLFVRIFLLTPGNDSPNEAKTAWLATKPTIGVAEEGKEAPTRRNAMSPEMAAAVERIQIAAKAVIKKACANEPLG